MTDYDFLRDGLTAGRLVPLLGPGALAGARDPQTGDALPADNRSLILAMNQGREMMPRLMVEFSRAAQHLEQRRGQAAVTRFLTGLYSRPWTRAPLHDVLAQLAPPWVVDLNRDHQLLDSYGGQEHLLVKGCARTMGSGLRYRLYRGHCGQYEEIDDSSAIDPAWPVLFKPLGCSLPEPSFIASDADYVDYLTELMGGFALPPALKTYRQQKQYLLMGVPLGRDTERMLVTEISYGAAQPRGWVFLEQPSPKERRYCARMSLEIIEQPLNSFTRFLQANPGSARACLS
ncbi:SIR2 family protein [Aestuariirhabdus litorea]|uniref:SIR2 family protein n=1 Tax=Aestuariirhabdus litorea TaxID=2528527 RepID=A0A3P3VJR2_9GAMM|nr:SIR2 family protein [Aestuariirhabdus litorea]RRJ82942.1 SIR2 family protein [Aestuariirhabdus litorea]RWW93101.1 SIR2 family protein [Endozoicomonadaceae bacterium GTF-13]